MYRIISSMSRNKILIIFLHGRCVVIYGKHVISCEMVEIKWRNSLLAKEGKAKQK